MRLLLICALAACSATATSTVTDDIINGTVASPAVRPWAAFLTIQLQNGNSTVCSGALVTPTKVLTAAHCAVCAQAIQVNLLGAQNTIINATTWAVNPAAYPVAPQCSLDSAQNELNTLTNVGGDLAVVTLATPSAVTPIAALAEPPFGWNPVTGTHGNGITGVTILGRGPASQNSDDTSTMREGTTSLDALSLAQHATCAPSPATTLPYLQLWNAGGEPTIQPGDSGGPMIATFWGTPRVMGVTSWFCADTEAYFAPTFVAETAPWLATQLGTFAPSGDADGDHVLDADDNCPATANSDQADGDGDLVGDVCDNCAVVANSDQANCNAEAEHALGATVRGDACDAAPCATVEVTWGAVPPALIPAPILPCLANGYGFATCSWEMPTGFAVTPVATAGAAPQPGDIGLRHCECAAPHDTAAERDANCRGAAVSCTIDAADYAPGSAWHALHVSGAGADPLTAVTFAPGINAPVDIAWDSVTDLQALGGALPPPPWTPDSDGIVDGVHLDGIVWAHVVDRAGTPTSALGTLGGVSIASLAGSYAAADHRFREIFHWHSIPQYAPAWPWTYCAACGDLELPWVVLADPARAIVMGVGPEGAIDLSARLSAGGAALLGRGRVVPAAEPLALLERASIARRALVIDPSGAPIGRFDATSGGVRALALEGPALRGTDSVRLLAYSALRDEAYAVRVSTSGGGATLQCSTAGRGWTAIALSGAALGTPLAIAVRAEEHALYVLDTAGVSTRLVRIDLDSGAATVLVARLLTRPGAVTLSVGLHGELLLAADVGTGAQLAWLVAGPSGARLVGRASSRLSLGGEARELPSGVHFEARDGRTFAPGFVAAGARRAPVASEGLEPLL